MILNYKFNGDIYGSRSDMPDNINCSYECGRTNDCDEHLALAIASVPMQKWRLTYSPEKALSAGTMFAELNLPFKGGKCR